MSIEKLDSLMGGHLAQFALPHLTHQAFAALRPENVVLEPRHFNVYHKIPDHEAEDYTLNYVVAPGTEAEDLRAWMRSSIARRGYISQAEGPPGPLSASYAEIDAAFARGYNIVAWSAGYNFCLVTDVIKSPHMIMHLRDLLTFHRVYTYMLVLGCLVQANAAHDVREYVYQKLMELKRHLYGWCDLQFNITLNQVTVSIDRVTNPWSMVYDVRSNLHVTGAGPELMKAWNKIYLGV